jgi:hypothetical protein
VQVYNSIIVEKDDRLGDYKKKEKLRIILKGWGYKPPAEKFLNKK